MAEFLTALAGLFAPESGDHSAGTDEGWSGQGTTEYVIIVTIVVALATVIALFRNQLVTMLQNIINALGAVA